MHVLINWFSIILSNCSLKTQDRIAKLIAIFLFSIVRFRRSLIISNIKTAFPHKQKREIIRIGEESVYHFVLTFIEFLAERNGNLAQNVSLEGVNHIKQALARNKGAYIICCHMGSWEAMGGAVTNQLKPAHVVVKKVGSRKLNDFIVNLRKKNGFLCLARQKKGDVYAGICNVLARGEIVGFVMDQARPGEPRLNFFNKPAKTNTSLAAIWKKNPAPLIPAYIVREKIGHHTVHFMKEINLAISENASQDILTHSQIFNQIVESIVVQCPEQYFWMHDRWK